MIDRNALNALWNSSEAVDSSNKAGLPDGKYKATLNFIRLEETSKGTPYINWDFVVADGDYKGRHAFNSMFVTEKTIKYNKGLFNKLGFANIPFDSFESTVYPVLADGVFEIFIKTSKSADGKDNQRVFINSFTPSNGVSASDNELPF